MAFRRYGKYYRRRGLRRGAKRTGMRRKTVSKSVKRYVKREIHRNIENKDKISYAANETMVSWGTGTQGYSIPLIEGLDKGTDDGQRVGNMAKCVKGIFRATINLKPYDGTSNNLVMPVFVKCFLVKSLSSTEQESSLPYYDLFFKGNGTAIDWQGNCLDLDLPINTDYFRVLKTMTFKLGSANPALPVASGGSTDAGRCWADNSPFAKRISINWSKYVRKQLKYGDSPTNVLNDNLYLVVQSVVAHGGDSTGKQHCEIHYVNTMTYEDA